MGNEATPVSGALGSRDKQQVDWITPLATAASYLYQYRNIKKNRNLLTPPPPPSYIAQTSGYIPVVKDLSAEQLASMENEKNAIRSGYKGSDAGMEMAAKNSASYQRGKLAMDQATLRAQNIARQEEAVNQYKAEDIQRQAAISQANNEKRRDWDTLKSAEEYKANVKETEDLSRLGLDAVNDLVIKPTQDYFAHKFQARANDVNSKISEIQTKLDINQSKQAYSNAAESILLAKERENLLSEYDEAVRGRPKNPNLSIARLFSSRKE